MHRGQGSTEEFRVYSYTGAEYKRKSQRKSQRLREKQDGSGRMNPEKAERKARGRRTPPTARGRR